MPSFSGFLQFVLSVALTSATPAGGASSSQTQWDFPEALLNFDEAQYTRTLEQIHDGGTESPGPSAWSILGPYEGEAHLSLGTYFYNQKQLDRALDEYRRSVQLNPDNPAAHFNLGLVYFDRKDYDAAEREYRTALELDPGFDLAYNNLGTLHLVQKNYQQAEKDFQDALRHNPEDLKARVNLGHIYFYVRKNYLAARREYQKALTQNPEIPLVRTNLETIVREQVAARQAEEKFEQSLKALERAPEPSSDHVEIFDEEPLSRQESSQAPDDLFRF